MTDAKPSIYLIDADPAERERIAASLAGMACAVFAFEDGHAFLSTPEVEEYACVLAALDLPDMDVLDFVTMAGRILPVIVLGHTDDLKVAVDVMRVGATDFLELPCNAQRLRAAVRNATRPLGPEP